MNGIEIAILTSLIASHGFIYYKLGKIEAELKIIKNQLENQSKK